MRLRCRCSNCKNEIPISVRASDRYVLAKKFGENFTVTCNKCKTRTHTHVNEVYAEVNKFISFGATMIFLNGTILLFILLWKYLFRTSIYGALAILGVIMIPYFVYDGINRSLAQNVNYFNTKRFG